VALYNEARKYCSEVGDYASMHLFEELILDEQGHIDFLETQIGLHDQSGAQNYGALNAESADNAE
jgi:bacterioferritin